MSVSISEAIEARKAVEQQISALLQRFSAYTGLKPVDIQVSWVRAEQMDGAERHFVTDVRLKCEL